MTHSHNVTDTFTEITGLNDGTTYFGQFIGDSLLLIHEGTSAPSDKTVPAFRYGSYATFAFQKRSGESIYVAVVDENRSGTLIYGENP